MDKPYNKDEHEFPKMRHHATEKPVIVEDPDEEATKTPDGDGWTDDLGKLAEDAKAKAPKKTAK